jgi:hypothetical protein
MRERGERDRESIFFGRGGENSKSVKCTSSQPHSFFFLQLHFTTGIQKKHEGSQEAVSSIVLEIGNTSSYRA